MLSARDHFKINMRESSPLDLSKPYQGTPHASEVELDEVEDEDQYDSNVQVENIQIDFLGFT